MSPKFHGDLYGNEFESVWLIRKFNFGEIMCIWHSSECEIICIWYCFECGMGLSQHKCRQSWLSLFLHFLARLQHVFDHWIKLNKCRILAQIQQKNIEHFAWQPQSAIHVLPSTGDLCWYERQSSECEKGSSCIHVQSQDPAQATNDASFQIALCDIFWNQNQQNAGWLYPRPGLSIVASSPVQERSFEQAAVFPLP